MPEDDSEYRSERRGGRTESERRVDRLSMERCTVGYCSLKDILWVTPVPKDVLRVTAGLKDVLWVTAGRKDVLRVTAGLRYVLWADVD